MEKLIVRGSNILKPPFRPSEDTLTPRSNTLLRRRWHPIRKLDNPRESTSNSRSDRRNGNGNHLSLPIAKTDVQPQTRGKRSRLMLNYSGNSFKRSGSLQPPWTKSRALFILRTCYSETSETIYSRLRSPGSYTWYSSRKLFALTVCRNATNQFRFPDARCRKKRNFARRKARGRKIFPSKYFMTNDNIF